jgi:membrane-bound ClpP family serine protease
MKKLKYLIPVLAVVLLAGLAAGAAAPRAVYVLRAVGSINPGLAEFIVEGIRQA